MLRIAFVVLALSLAAGAQEKKPAAPATKAPAPAAEPAAPPQATELERTQLENIQLKMMLLQQEEQSLPQRKMELQQAYGAVIQRIQQEHPGYVWNPQVNGLVPAPKPAPKPAEAQKK